MVLKDGLELSEKLLLLIGHKSSSRKRYFEEHVKTTFEQFNKSVSDLIAISFDNRKDLRAILARLERNPNDFSQTLLEVQGLSERWYEKLAVGRLGRRRAYASRKEKELQELPTRIRKAIYQIVSDDERLLLKDFFSSMNLGFFQDEGYNLYRHELRHQLDSLTVMIARYSKTPQNEVARSDIQEMIESLDMMEAEYVDGFEIVSRKFARIEAHFT